MVKGLLGKKEKVAQAVDKSPACVDKCLSINAPLWISLTAYPYKDCVLQAFLVFCAMKAQKEVRKLSLAYCALRRWLGKEKERVFGSVPYFLSIYWLRV